MRRFQFLYSAASHAKFKNYPLPQPFQSISLRGHATGDDCSVASSKYLGVADGVGQWNRREHGSAGLWSRLMITAFAEKMDVLHREEHNGIEGRQLIDMLEESYHAIMAMCKHPTARPTGPSPKGGFTTTSMSDPLNRDEKHRQADGKEVEYQGSTTLICAVLQYTATQTLLHIVNIGDSSLILIRNNNIIYKSDEQQHWFDCPYQIGHHSPDTPKLSSSLSTIELEEDDIIIASTDGLGDNVYPAQILETVIDESTKHPGSEINLDAIAQRLCELARDKMADEWGESPFGDKAICEGVGFMGGKRDDVSILVVRLVATSVKDRVDPG